MLKIGNVVRLKRENTCGVISEIRTITPQLNCYSCVTFNGDVVQSNYEKEFDFLNRNLVEFFMDYK
jgi:hypothetical protein